MSNKPIKIICEDGVEIKFDGNKIEVNKRIIGIEAEQFISNIFGTTDIGALSCSDITDEDTDCYFGWNYAAGEPFRINPLTYKHNWRQTHMVVDTVLMKHDYCYTCEICGLTKHEYKEV